MSMQERIQTESLYLGMRIVFSIPWKMFRNMPSEYLLGFLIIYLPRSSYSNLRIYLNHLDWTYCSTLRPYDIQYDEIIIFQNYEIKPKKRTYFEE